MRPYPPPNFSQLFCLSRHDGAISRRFHGDNILVPALQRAPSPFLHLYSSSTVVHPRTVDAHFLSHSPFDLATPLRTFPSIHRPSPSRQPSLRAVPLRRCSLLPANNPLSLRPDPPTRARSVPVSRFLYHTPCESTASHPYLRGPPFQGAVAVELDVSRGTGALSRHGVPPESATSWTVELLSRH